MHLRFCRLRSTIRGIVLVFDRLCVMQVSLCLLIQLLDLVDLVWIEHILITNLLQEPIAYRLGQPPSYIKKITYKEIV